MPCAAALRAWTTRSGIRPQQLQRREGKRRGDSGAGHRTTALSAQFELGGLQIFSGGQRRRVILLTASIAFLRLFGSAA